MDSKTTSQNRKEIAKQRSLLSRQKPKRRQRLRIPKWRPITLGLVTIGVFSWTWRKAQSFSTHRPHSVSFVDKNQEIPTELKTSMARQVSQWIHDNPETDISELAVRLQTQFQLQSISLTMVSQDHLVARLNQRKAALYVDLDQLRPVSDLGRVYYMSPVIVEKGLPTLKNLPQEGRLQVEPDGTFALDPLRQTLITEALELNSKLSNLNLQTEAIVYEPYRGFSINLGGTLEVFLGRKPFDLRLKHLRDTLKELAASGVQATRIELDYAGKAFIKHQATL